MKLICLWCRHEQKVTLNQVKSGKPVYCDICNTNLHLSAAKLKSKGERK